VLPNISFTNTQLKTANTQFILTFKSKYPIPQKNLSTSLNSRSESEWVVSAI